MIKFFDIQSYDMVNMISVSFVPGAVCWLTGMYESQLLRSLSDRIVNSRVRRRPKQQRRRNILPCGRGGHEWLSGEDLPRGPERLCVPRPSGSAFLSSQVSAVSCGTAV